MSTTPSVIALNDELNQSILAGKALDAFERLYADGVVMQENTKEPTVGKAANREHEIQFFSSIETLHGIELLGTAANGDVSYAEMIFDVTFKGGQRVKLTQVAARRWKDGQIVHERFYYGA
jgi:ketosteroid isomerase-like protein